jgi:hypothetical protein
MAGATMLPNERQIMPLSRQQHPSAQNTNEGEGSRTAAHRYEEGVRRTVQTGHIAEKAAEAVRALASPEGAELRRAEAAAKHHKSPPAQLAHAKPAHDKPKKR